jgi:hypothetical protein
MGWPLLTRRVQNDHGPPLLGLRARVRWGRTWVTCREHCEESGINVHQPDRTRRILIEGLRVDEMLALPDEHVTFDTKSTKRLLQVTEGQHRRCITALLARLCRHGIRPERQLSDDKLLSAAMERYGRIDPDVWFGRASLLVGSSVIPVAFASQVFACSSRALPSPVERSGRSCGRAHTGSVLRQTAATTLRLGAEHACS